MAGFTEGKTGNSFFLPECLDDYVTEDNPARVGKF